MGVLRLRVSLVIILYEGDIGLLLGDWGNGVLGLKPEGGAIAFYRAFNCFLLPSIDFMEK